jgi:hypothetical protein
MITYQRLKQTPTLFKCFTGLTLKAFHHLLVDFRLAYEADLDERDRQREQPRQRRRGGGQKGALVSLENKMSFATWLMASMTW